MAKEKFRKRVLRAAPGEISAMKIAEIEYGLKEFFQGVLIGFIIGFIVAIVLI